MNTEKRNTGNDSAQDFRLLAPTLEKYAKVPGSLITILQQAQDILSLIHI